MNELRIIPGSPEPDNRMVSIRCNGTVINIRLDTGADKTVFGEKDWNMIKESSNVELRRTNICIVPYGTTKSQSKLSAKGVANVKLTAPAGAEINTEVIVMDGDAESLLGQHDVVDLGFIAINKEGAKEAINNYGRKNKHVENNTVQHQPADEVERQCKTENKKYQTATKDALQNGIKNKQKYDVSNKDAIRNKSVNRDVLRRDAIKQTTPQKGTIHTEIKDLVAQKSNHTCSISQKNIAKIAKEFNKKGDLDWEILATGLGYELEDADRQMIRLREYKDVEMIRQRCQSTEERLKNVFQIFEARCRDNNVRVDMTKHVSAILGNMRIWSGRPTYSHLNLSSND